VATPLATERPNIVLILADDMDAGLLASMPNVKRLIADRGATFERAYASYPLCAPSRATILTGRYAHNTGVLSNGQGGTPGGYPAFHAGAAERSTIATWLTSAGYRTAFLGKYLNQYYSTFVPPGWSTWAATTTIESFLIGFDYRLNQNGRSVAYGSDPASYATDVLTRQSLAFIRRSVSAGKPFFLLAAVAAPHWPATPAPRHAHLFANARVPRTPSFGEVDTSDKPPFLRAAPLPPKAIQGLDGIQRNRLRSLRAVDEAVKAIHDRLMSLGVLDRTFLVFTADNGLRMGQHNMMGKRTGYEEDIRLPLVVRGPGVPAGIKLQHLVTNADLAPTFAAWAGAARRHGVDGRSFATLVDGTPPAPSGWRHVVPLEHWREKPMYDFPIPLPDYKGLRSRRYTYVEYKTGHRELYDNTNDPHQLRNLARIADAALLRRLSARTAELAACQAAACRAAEDRPGLP
jgi:arylsulfatase A-like enzyme